MSWNRRREFYMRWTYRRGLRAPSLRSPVYSQMGPTMTEIVFHPNVSTERLENLLEDAREHGSTNWSSKKAAAADQLYLFYWGKPHARIVAVGRPTGEVERGEGKTDWTSALVQYYAEFNPLVALENAVSVEEIIVDPVLAKWWAKKPYQGNPKKVEKPFADRLLALVIRGNPSVQRLVKQTVARMSPPPKVLDKELRDLPDAERVRVRREIGLLLRDARLRPSVLRVWGAACALCGLSMEDGAESECEVAHIEPVADGGADKIKNALPLCRTHHWAFDRFLWAIEPDTLRVRIAPKAKNSLLSKYAGRRIRSPSGERKLPLETAISRAALRKRWNAFDR